MRTSKSTLKVSVGWALFSAALFIACGDVEKSSRKAASGGTAGAGVSGAAGETTGIGDGGTAAASVGGRGVGGPGGGGDHSGEGGSGGDTGDGGDNATGGNSDAGTTGVGGIGGETGVGGEGAGGAGGAGGGDSHLGSFGCGATVATHSVQPLPAGETEELVITFTADVLLTGSLSATTGDPDLVILGPSGTPNFSSARVGAEVFVDVPLSAGQYRIFVLAFDLLFAGYSLELTTSCP